MALIVSLTDKIRHLLSGGQQRVVELQAVKDLFNSPTNSPVTATYTAVTPASGAVGVVEDKFGPFYQYTLTLAAFRIPVTDGAASGSYGSANLLTLPEGSYTLLGCRQNYIAFAEGAALTTGAGDAVFVIGVGTGAVAAAADGALSGTSVNIGAAVSVTDAAGTGAGTAHDGCKTTAVDGTGTAPVVRLNWSGTAATIDANSTIDVTGTITLTLVRNGDD